MGNVESSENARESEAQGNQHGGAYRDVERGLISEDTSA